MTTDGGTPASAGRVTAILGGTFDPIHAGHIHASRIARDALDTPSVTLLLAARPSHRSAHAGVEHRWRMLELVAETDASLIPSDVEVSRPGPSYTVDTLADVAGDDPLVWLIGRDALEDIHSWRQVERLASLCHLLVLDRPGGARTRPTAPVGFRFVEDARQLAARSSGGLAWLTDPMLDISASQVRRLIARGEDAGALLTAEVWSYIRAHGLYAPGSEARVPEGRRQSRQSP